ncbi:MAG TPA: hypothetical protein VG106_08710 [Vicinamibacterales bacterium]|nr:hypothetical protein [Vicinamibacterales bacterium]
MTEGAISMQLQQLPVRLPPQAQPPTLPPAATFEITKEQWERVV